MITSRKFIMQSMLYVLLGALPIAGCSSQESDTYGAQTPESTPFLAHAPMTVIATSDSMGVPLRLGVSRQYLIALDAVASRALHIFDRKTGRYLGSTGRTGQGPGEVGGTVGSNVQVVDVGGTEHIWMYDSGNSRLYDIDVERSLNPQGVIEGRMISLKTEARILDPMWINDSTLVGLPYGGVGGRLAWFAPDGALTKSAGSILSDWMEGREDVSVPVWTQVFQGFLKAKSDGSRIMVLDKYVAQLEIYDEEGTLLAAVREPGSGLPHFVDQGGHMASDATARLAYFDAAVTADRIYAVYSGRTRKEGGAEAAFGREIRVFDWKGTLVKRRTVDDILSAIAVDPSDPSFVYAVAFMPDARIVRIPVG